MNTPDDLNSIAKMVNDTIRQRKKQPKPPNISFNGHNVMPGALIVFTGNGVMLLDVCNDCGQPSSQQSPTCKCPCHQEIGKPEIQ